MIVVGDVVAALVVVMALVGPCFPRGRSLLREAVVVFALIMTCECVLGFGYINACLGNFFPDAVVFIVFAGFFVLFFFTARAEPLLMRILCGFTRRFVKVFRCCFRLL